MKNKIIIICIAVIIILGIAIGGFFYISSNNNTKTVDEIAMLIRQEKYSDAGRIITEKSMIGKENEKIHELINEKVTKYKVTSVDDFLNLNDENWNNIKSLYQMTNDIGISDDYKYLATLLNIKDKYEEYIPAIMWDKSADSEAFSGYLKVEKQEDFGTSARFLKNYSFEKYGTESTYIKELNDEMQKYINYAETIEKSLKTNDVSLYNEIHDDFTDNITKIADIQIKIIQKNDELKKDIKNLQLEY